MIAGLVGILLVAVGALVTWLRSDARRKEQEIRAVIDRAKAREAERVREADARRDAEKARDPLDRANEILRRRKP